MSNYPEDNQKREEELLKLRDNCAGFIRDGYKFADKNKFGPWKDYQWVYFDYGHRDEDDSYVDHIDDAKQRFDWIISHWEACIRNGEVERMTGFLKALALPKNVGMSEGNFKDLALKTAFVKNKQYLRSLMDEIKLDVFDNEGDIRLDMRLKPFRELSEKHWFIFRNSRPPFENIIYFPYPVYTEENIRNYFRHRPVPRSLSGEGGTLDFLISVLKERASAHGRSEKEFLPFGNYIGMLENGKNEIRVIAQTTDYSDSGKFMYWDTFIDDIIPTLRTAIEWFIRKPESIPYINLDEDASWMDEAQDFYSDGEDVGYLDDD